MIIRFENSINITNEYGDFFKVPLLIIDAKNILSIEINHFTLINGDNYYASYKVINKLIGAFAIDDECYTIN